MNLQDLLIEKAVDLWCDALKKPEFNNGDLSSTGILGQGLAMWSINKDKEKMGPINEKLIIFREELIKLMQQIKNKHKDHTIYLSVDYHPCELLSLAAEKAGIPESQFSCKSTVMVRQDSVHTRFGYGATGVFYYLLNDDTWHMTTTLNDVDKELLKENDNE